MRIGQPISKDVKLASKSCNIFWWQMLQFISSTQPSLSACAGTQDRVTGLHVRLSQNILWRLGDKSQVKLLTPHSTASLGQYSSAKMKRRINPSSSKDQVPQKDIVVLDCSQHQNHTGLIPKLARHWGEGLHAHIPSQPH